MNKSLERLLWSIALPGFGQLLNKRYIKGITFIILEVLINVQANFNSIIMYSFNGEINRAFEDANYLWLMFYPCLYFFAMWDAYKDAGGGSAPFSYLPFVSCAYFVTVGLMLSAKVKVYGTILGPVWLPMIFVIPGIAFGLIVREVLLHYYSE
ncbi:hypothetical protein JOC95_003390 [Bacillus tianshenii]|uniref:Uncharacterized protein n=1 Tax=Sutcliffiella tianshenii TaxID=1463404 RepID=A0ABS2P3R7_9BACI|nr:hypothetical protein [Bacillus tianshenii]MBM7621501.1 hypothetical protein [Bacillus tianshenii]MCA1319206.1 hypothetical protein [Bacillus tianshenii]